MCPRPTSRSSGQCPKGYSSMDRTDTVCPTSASWHKTSRRSRQNQAWLPGPRLAKSGSAYKKLQLLDVWIVRNLVMSKATCYENSTSSLELCANVKIAAGAEIACFKNDIWPSVFVHIDPQTAWSGKGSCIIQRNLSAKHMCVCWNAWKWAHICLPCKRGCIYSSVNRKLLHQEYWNPHDQGSP